VVLVLFIRVQLVRPLVSVPYSLANKFQQKHGAALGLKKADTKSIYQFIGG
jgi:hypothetical protein